MRQPIGEIKKFGEELTMLGETHSVPVLIEYGKNLKNAAEVFNIKAIISLIKQFPAITGSIKSKIKEP